MKTMKWIALIAFVLAIITSAAFAGGDQNQGSKGKGKVHQHQVSK